MIKLEAINELIDDTAYVPPHSRQHHPADADSRHTHSFKVRLVPGPQESPTRSSLLVSRNLLMDAKLHVPVF